MAMKYHPTPTALRMFVEAAERASFAGAARALNVTQAAVSKQMANLEDRLGVALFSRTHRSVTLTAAGRSYLPVAKRVLVLLEMGVDEASSVPQRRTIKVEVDYEFLDFVLTPRLEQVRIQMPEIDVIFIPAGPGRHIPQSDFAITYGHPRPGAASISRLCSFTVFPVARPSLLKKTTEPFNTLQLLHDVDTYWWNCFLQAEGTMRSDQGIILGTGALAIRGAIAGQGIAIGDDLLCADTLAAGELERVGEATFPGRDDYWLSEHPNMQGDPLAATFRDWLTDEIEQLNRSG
ncbi:MAG: LysR family transcriptional regulator [Pseudomonadota bacterium]